MVFSQSTKALEARNAVRYVQLPYPGSLLSEKPRPTKREFEAPTSVHQSSARRRTDLSMGILNTLARSSHLEQKHKSQSPPKPKRDSRVLTSPRPVKHSLQSVSSNDNNNKLTEQDREAASSYAIKPRTFQLQRPQKSKSSVAPEELQKEPISNSYSRNSHESQSRHRSLLDTRDSLRQPRVSSSEAPNGDLRTSKDPSPTLTKCERFEAEALVPVHRSRHGNLASRDPEKNDSFEESQLQVGINGSSTVPTKFSVDHKGIHTLEKPSSDVKNGDEKFCRKRRRSFSPSGLVGRKRRRSSSPSGLGSGSVRTANCRTESSEPSCDATPPLKVRKVALQPKKKGSGGSASLSENASTPSKSKPRAKVEPGRMIVKKKNLIHTGNRLLRPLSTTSTYRSRLASLRSSRSRNWLRQIPVQVGGGSVLSRSQPQAHDRGGVNNDEASNRKEEGQESNAMKSAATKSSPRSKAVTPSPSSSQQKPEPVRRRKSMRLAKKPPANDVIVIDDSDEEENADDVKRTKEADEFDITRLGFAMLTLESPKRLKDLPPCPFLDPLRDEEESEVAKLYRQRDKKEIKVIPSARIILRAEDFKRLRGVRWLNDEVINAYISLINVRNDSIFTELADEERKRIPRTYVFNTFFYTRLTSGPEGYDYAGVRRWTGRDKVDVMKQDLLLFPINLGNHHWVLAGIDQPKRTFMYLDSMAGLDRSGFLASLRRWYYDELVDKYGEKVAKEKDLESWPSAYNRYMIRRVGVLPTKLEPRNCEPRLARIPVQTDGGSCGVFIAKMADCLSLGIKIYFNQDDIPLVRRRMALDLLRGQLLL